MAGATGALTGTMGQALDTRLLTPAIRWPKPHGKALARKPYRRTVCAAGKRDIVPKAVAEQLSSSEEEALGFNIDVDNTLAENATVIRVTGLNRPGLLTALTKTFQNLNLDVVKVTSNSGPQSHD